MADVKISALPASSTPLAGTEILPIVQSATTRQVSVANLTAGRAVNALSITASSLTSGRVTYAGTAGLLQDSANLTFNGTTLTANTIGAYTLSGTIAGGGNQINNVIIGTSTPLAGSFTTINASTSITNAGLTSGRVTYAGASGLLSDSANLQFTGTSLLVGSATATANFNFIASQSNDTTAGAMVENTSNTASATAVMRYKNSGSTFAYTGLGSPSRDVYGGLGPNILAMYSNSTAGITLMVDAAGPITFVTGSTPTERMRVDSSNQILIGTSSNTTNGGFVFATDFYGAGRSTQIIGHINGASSGDAYMVFNYNGTGIGSITQSGTSAVLYNVTSDQRLKTNVVDALSGNIDDIKVRSFDWIADGSHQEYGMVAQELIEVAPYAVNKPKNPNEMMGVDYSKLVPMMIKEIQDLKQRITVLENK